MILLRCTFLVQLFVFWPQIKQNVNAARELGVHLSFFIFPIGVILVEEMKRSTNILKTFGSFFPAEILKAPLIFLFSI